MRWCGVVCGWALMLTCIAMPNSAGAVPPSSVFCRCMGPDGVTQVYNLSAGVPQACSKHRYYSGNAKVESLSANARNAMCKTGKIPRKLRSKSSKNLSKKGKKVSSSSGKRTQDTARKKVSVPTAKGSPPDTPFNAAIVDASKTHDIPVELIHAVIRVESNYNPDAVSSAGAQGLMQLMPGTASDMKVADSFDPKQNIMGGTKYLRRLADHYDGDIVKTLAAYHAGFRAVDKTGGIPYEQTERYVKKVLSHFYKMQPAP